MLHRNIGVILLYLLCKLLKFLILFILLNVVILTFIKELHISSLSFLLTGAAWNFTGRKSNILNLHTQTYIHDHIQITVVTENSVPICNREISNY